MQLEDQVNSDDGWINEERKYWDLIEFDRRDNDNSIRTI